MKSSGFSGPVILAALAVIVIMAAAYLLAIKPEFDAAASANADRALAVDENDFLQLNLDRLQALEKESAGWDADLELIDTQIPAFAETDELERVIRESAAAAGPVVIDYRLEAISAIDGTAFVMEGGEDGGSGTGAATEDGAGASPEAEEEQTAEEQPAIPEASPVVDGLVALQFSIVAEGTPDAVARFVKELHEQSQRYITVYGFSILQTLATDGAPGRPALFHGDWSITMSAMAFSLVDPSNSFIIDEPDGVDEWSGSLDNPFAPVVPAT